VCLEKVAICDVFVGLVGHLHGSRPDGSEISFTQLEYETARRVETARLMFLAEEDFPVPFNLREPDEEFRRQMLFRQQVQGERTVAFFREPQKLATMVVAALQTLQAHETPQDKEEKRRLLVSRATAMADEATLRDAYLNRLIEQNGFLALSGVDPTVAGSDRDARLHLRAVYTPLLTLSPRDDGPLAGGYKLPPESGTLRRAATGMLSAIEQLNRHPRLVLLGDPGSGKSTFARFVAICLAGELLGRREINLQFLTTPLPEDHGRGGDVAQSWEHRNLLPVLIVLRDFAARGLPKSGERATALSLWQFLEGEMEEAGLLDSFPLVRRELLAGRGLAILDGLDEVPEAERRREHIRRAVEDFSSSLGTSRVLLTSRTYAYQDQAWRLPGFEEAVLAPFSRGLIDRFIGLWYEQMAALGRLRKEDAQGRAELLRRAILGSDRLLSLAERPLLLTLMASLHAWRGGSLPERREELYAKAVELILNTWERQRLELDPSGTPVLLQPSLAEWLKVDRHEVRQVLEEIAFEAHGAQADLSGTADVEEGKLVGRLLHLSRNPGADAVQLVTYLRDRAGLLVERGTGVYTFTHRTFQEYLAACHLTGGSFPEEAARLGREDPERWREVVLLAGAKAARGAVASVWYLADALCFREPGGAEAGFTDEWGALLAGQAVAESADLPRVAEANQMKLERLRRWLVHLMRSELFPARERAAAGTALAALGDPRFDPALWSLPKEPFLGFVAIPEGPFQMGSDLEDDPHAVSRELQRHEISLPTYWMARFPVTVAQFRAFVEASGYQPVDPGCLEGAENNPVVRVTWGDALSYFQWLEECLRELVGKRQVDGDLGGFWESLAEGRFRACLPSEAEWEKAARGTDGRIYPWGKEADPNRANFNASGLFERSPVGCFHGGASPYGCEEMSGNVWEWTRSLGGEFPRPWFRYPYVETDARKDLQAPPQILRVLRGGAFTNSFRRIRCAFRSRNVPDLPSARVGFRVVLVPIPDDEL
jgi:formylglycine-generating enzyme required for sulfatase activity